MDNIEFAIVTGTDNRCRFDSEEAITRLEFQSRDDASAYVNVCARHLDVLAVKATYERDLWALRTTEIAKASEEGHDNQGDSGGHGERRHGYS